MRLLPLILASALLAGCSANRQAGDLFGTTEAPTLVVDALLLVGQPLPPIFLRRTLAPDQVYTSQRAGVRNAAITLIQADQSFSYSAAPDSAGHYLPPLDPPLVQPQTEYRLEINAEGTLLKARTITPPRLAINRAVLLNEETLEVVRQLKTFNEAGEASYTAQENRITHLEGLVELWLEPIAPVAYQLALINIETDSEFLIDADFLEEEDINDFERQGSSPPLDILDGRARLPWFAVAFAGRHVFKVFALEQNWFDYVRSNPDNTFFAGGLAGDNFERPIFNIEGGIGLFGAASVDSLGFYIEPAKK